MSEFVDFFVQLFLLIPRLILEAFYFIVDSFLSFVGFALSTVDNIGFLNLVDQGLNYVPPEIATSFATIGLAPALNIVISAVIIRFFMSFIPFVSFK